MESLAAPAESAFASSTVYSGGGGGESKRGLVLDPSGRFSVILGDGEYATAIEKGPGNRWGEI